MRVGVVGTGHVGLVTCASLAAIGHDVVGCDSDQGKLHALRRGEIPFHEPGLADLLAAPIGDGRLSFSPAVSGVVGGADVVFICVGTPPRASGEANLLAVEEAAREIARAATGSLVVVEKSTVPAGTAVRLQRVLELERPDLGPSIDVVSNPEFLREGQAVVDAMNPDRILVGAGSARAFGVMRELYRPFLDQGTRLVEADITSAELAKHACNAFLALKISYANALARLCEAAGADIEAVTAVMGSDPRIGPHFLRAGLGFGGYCFPKDLIAFERLAEQLGTPFPMLAEISRINDGAIEAAAAKVREGLWNLEGKRVALLGLAFKPGTDDVRFSPALALARKLMAEGATVVGYDPVAGEPAKAEIPELLLADDPYEAAAGSHCVVVCTEWDEVSELDFAKLGEVVAFKILVDGRNAVDGDAATRAGFSYHPTGRPARGPLPGRAGA